MSQTAPPSEKAVKSASSPLVPPDERFWQRYSPHAELPLSSAGSFVTHILLFGLLLLASFLSTLLFNNNRSLPVEAVRVSGGGGSPKGQGDGPNRGQPVEAEVQSNEKPETAPTNDVPPQPLKIQPETATKQNFDDSQRRIQEDDKASDALSKLSQRTVRIQLPGNRPHGKGGSGSGGGLGKGIGPGVGDGTGAGNLTPTQREKRMLRWSMLFNTPDSANYVAQLRGLGAILAIPVREDGSGGAHYQIIRDLSARPAKLLDEDIGNIQRLVRWRDELPASVSGVMLVLRLNVRPSHFDAFMPVELEQKLLDLELGYLHKHYPGRQEDDIESTKFRINARGGKYEPEVRQQTLK